MSTTPPASPIAEQRERARFLAVEVGEWPGLEQPVRLDLDARTTVLIGKNGAGKSLLMEGFYWAALQAGQWYAPKQDRRPQLFRCNLELPDRPAFGYECRVDEVSSAREKDTTNVEEDPWADLRAQLPSWSERGFRLDDGTELWRARDATLSIPGKEPVRPARGILSLHGLQDHPEIQAEAQALARLLGHVQIVHPGTLLRENDFITQRAARRAVLLQRREDQKRGQWSWNATDFSEVDELGESLAEMSQRNRLLFEQLCDVLRGLDLVRDITLRIYRNEPPTKSGEPASGDIAAVLFDGVNLGFCSDGTLRIARIVLDLLRPQVSCLLIEEPETAVHPGLLDKLLSLVEAYSTDRQIVLSTHSPQVVDRFAPDQLRLVEREEGVPRVHALSAADRDLAMSYLHDQGSLSDFVFRRSDG